MAFGKDNRDAIRILWRFVCALVFLGAATAASSSSATVGSAEGLPNLDYQLTGLTFEVSPTTLTVPRGVATQFNTSVPGVEALPSGASVIAVLRGPSFPGTLEITSTPGDPIYLPPFSQPGTHFLEDIRLAADGETILPATPPDVTINVLDELLVADVSSRPLSLDEIRDLGIEFDEESFQAFKFTLAFITESRVVEIDYPVLIPLQGGLEEPRVINAPSSLSRPSLPGLEFPSISIQPFMLEIIADEKPEIEPPRIPGIIVIPGNVAFLNQFFSVFVAVSNEAPDGTPLVVRDVRAEVFLPTGADNVVGDIVRDPPYVPGEPEFDNPLRIAKTAAGRENIKPVLADGPDARPGTPDDIDELAPQGSGNAEFLVEGRREGGHIIDVEIRGTLVGLPSGPVEVAGHAKGAVVVRDPNFALTFIHPNIVRAGETYELLVQLQNTSQVDANLLTVSIDPRNLSGARLLDPDDASQLIETLPPGEAASLTFELEALRTGQVVASTLELEDQAGVVSGRRVSLRAGVSEQGVPLSPDTLLLPHEVSKLRERAGNVDLTFRALALLGQAHSIATAPRGSLPTGVVPISSDTVIQRALELTEAAVRLEFSWRAAADGSSEPLPEGLLLTLQDLYYDFLGAGFADDGWDVLYRDSRQARLFGEALAEVVGREADAVGSIDLLDLQRTWADTESYRDPQITIMTQAAGPEIPVVLALVDADGRRLGGSLDAQGGKHEIPGADLLVFEQGGAAVGQFAVLTQTASSAYGATLEVLQAGTFDLGIVALASDGELRHIVFRSLSVSTGDQLLVTIQPDLTSPVELLQNGDPVTPSTQEVVPDGPPEVLGVVQNADYNIDVFGRVVAVLFDEDVETDSAEELAAYRIRDAVIPVIPAPDLIDGNRVLGAQAQFGDRIVFLGLRDPVGPFVDRRIDIAGVRDLRGQEMLPVQDRPIIPDPEGGAGGQLTGRVLRADGSPVADAEITYFPSVLTALGCQNDIAISIKSGDSEGRYGLDFVALETCGDGHFRIRGRDLQSGEEGALPAVVRADSERLTLDIVLVGRGSVEGLVRDETGVPVVNAVVSITSATDGAQRGVVTDQNGFYRIGKIPVGAIGIRVSSPAGHALASRSVAADTVSRVDITLLSSLVEGVLTGEVRLPDNSIAANVQVLISEELGNAVSASDGFLDATTTDEAGTFRFEGMPPGSYRVRGLDRAAGFIGDARIEVTAQNGPGDPAFVLVILNGTGSASGTVFKRVGNTLVPVPGALVAGGLELVTANEAGHYFIPRVPVGVSAITAADPATGARGSTLVTILTAGQESVGIDVVAEPLGTVTGRVFDPDGQPVSAGQDVLIIVMSTGDRFFVRRTQTAADGSYEFDRLDLKDYPLTVMRGGAVANGKARLSKSVREDAVDLRLVRSTGLVSGHVIDETGLAVAAKVKVKARAPNTAGLLVFKEEATTISDPDAGFTVGGLFLGPYTVTASSFFAPESVTVSGSLTDGAPTADVTLVLAKNTATLNGCVLDPDGAQITPVLDGQGIPRALSVFITSGQLRSELSEDTQNPEPDGIRVDASTGCYVSSIPLPPDSYTIQVTDDRVGSPTFGLTAQAMQEVKKGEDAERDVRLLGLGSLAIEVVDSAGQTLPGTTVQVTRTTYPDDVQEAFFSEPTDASPAIFSNLTEGPVTVSALVSSDPAVDVGGREELRGFGGNTRGDVVRGVLQTVRVVVDAAGNVVGRFLQPDGVTPVTNAQVTLLGVALPGEDQRTASDVTDVDGAYEFVGIPVGSFNLDGFDPSTARRGSAQGEIDFDGQQVTLDIELGPMGTVRGTVLGAERGEPVAGAEVSLFIDPNSPTPRRSTTEPDGSFIFESVAGGRPFSVTAVSLDGLSGNAEGAISFEGEVAELEVVLEGGARIEGTVFDAFGNPVPAADVTLTDQADNSRSTQAETTGADAGRFVFDNVPLGWFSIDARPPAALPLGDGGRAEVTVESAGQVITTDISFQGTIAVGVVVSGMNGSALVEVRLTSDGLFGGQAVPTTVQSGVYLFEGVPRAPLTVSARQQTPVGTEVSATALLGAADLPAVGSRLVPDIELVLSESANVRGVVNDSAGAPVLGARVLLQAGIVSALARSDVDGGFEFLGLPFDVPLNLRAEARGEALALFAGSIDVDGVVHAAAGTALTEVALVLDEEAPSVLDVTPRPGAASVTTLPSIVVTFSEPIDPASVQTCPPGPSTDPPSFRLLESTGTTPSPSDPTDLCDDSNVVPLEAVLSADGMTLTLTPLRELLGVTRHTATVSRGVVDLNGALLGGIRDLVGKPMNEDSTWAFVTRDNVPPTVARVSPADEAVNVSGESVVRITFSEPVDPRTVDATSLSVEGPAGGLLGQIDLILGNTVAVFTPTDAGGTRAFLQSDASYQVSVSGVADPAGNLQRPEDAVSVTFRTQDTIPPVVASVGAPPAARPGQLIVVPATVSDADVASVEFFVDGVLVGVVSSPAAPGEYRMTLTMPAKAVHVAARAIDTSGNVGPLSTPVVVGLLNDEPPLVTISEPTPGTVVSPGTTVRFVVNVSDDVAVVRVDGALSGAITALLGGEIASVPSVTIPFDVDVPASATGGSLTFAAVGTDNQGQASAPATLTVVIADETLPTVQIASPAAGSAVAPGETLDVRVLAQDNVTVSSVSLEASGAASFFESRAVSPAASSFDTIFQVAIPSGATAADTLNLTALAVDAAGNASLAASISLDVLDVNSPVVTLLVKDGITEVLRGGTLTVTVSATDDVGVSRLDFEAQGAFQATGTALISPALASASNDFVITVPGIASPGTPLTIVGTAQDEAGNAASSAPTSITIVENAPPTVSLTAPADGSQIAAGSTVTLSADADDDLGVTEVEFFVDGVSAGIDTAAPYSVEHTLPSVAGTTSVVIEVFATDNLGQMASDAVTVSVSSDITPPHVASVLPADGAVEVAITSFVDVTFSEPITPATITSTSFSVLADASAVSGSFSFSSDNADVRFTPADVLPFAAVVTIELTQDITDDAGNPLANADGTPLTQPLSFVFTTGSFGITNPTDGGAVVENTEIVLEARGSSSLNIASVTFAVNGEELPPASGTPFIATFIAPAAETTPTLTIIATARDSGGSEVALDQVVVDVLVGLAIQPHLVGIPIGGTATLRLTLSSPSNTDLTVALSAVDPAFVSLPNQVVLTAGQTEALVSVTGAATGNTTILTSSSRGSPAAIVSVSEPVAQQQQVVLAPVVGVAVPAPPSVGQLIIGASDQQTVDVRLLSGAVAADTPVIITSSDPAVADVQGPVVIAAGEQVASLSITTGAAGEATLTLQVGSEVRQITVFVGTPPPGRVPAIVAAPVGVAVLAPPSVGQVIMGVTEQQSVEVRLLSGALSVDTPVIITSSDPAVADVQGPVVITAGELVALLTITTGAAGEATLTLRVGTTVRQITVFVGAPPPGRVPAIVAAPVGVFVLAPPSAGPVIMGESEQQTLDVRLLSGAVSVDTPVVITSSDPAVANVQSPVVIAAGEQVAPLTITTGATGEATLTVRVGSEVRQITVFVGTPPPGRVPAIVAPMIGVDVNE